MTLYEGKKILKKRLRDENNIPYGMIVALNKDQLGYSVCHSKLDRYNDEEAFKIAYNRAKSQKDTNSQFWIDRRKRSLCSNPPVGSKSIMFNSSNYITDLEYETIERYKDMIREIMAFYELIKMENRAIRYFK